MTSVAAQAQQRTLIALISDEDTATGLLLAGIGHISSAAEGQESGNKGAQQQQQQQQSKQQSSSGGNALGEGDRTGQATSTCHERNFFIVNNATSIPEIETAFDVFTQQRNDIAILLITQPLAEKIRQVCDRYQQAFPAVLEIPSKDAPYGEC